MKTLWIGILSLGIALPPIRVAPAAAQILPSQQSSAPAVLKSSTRLVEVSVVVKDEHGSPVTNLNSKDFELLDNGKRQEIRLFNAADPRSGPARTVSVSGPQSNSMISNRRPADPASSNPVTVILIDARNTYSPERMAWTELVYARDQLIKFLLQIRPEDRLGIYLMGRDGFWILNEYTETCAGIVSRLTSRTVSAHPDTPARSKAKDVWSEFAAHFPRSDAATLSAIHHSQFAASSWIDRRYENPLAVLESVAAHLAGVQGRKNVILISGQMFLPDDLAVRAKMLNTIIQAGIAIYAIDPSGLAPYALDASFVIPSGVTMSSTRPGRDALGHISSRELAQKYLATLVQSSLMALSSDTGGRAFTNSNDIMQAIKTSFEDSSMTYTLGFYPRDSAGDGSFHRIKVKVKAAGRRLTVRHRIGYFDREEMPPDSQRPLVDMQQAVWSPVDATGIGLEAAVERSPVRDVCPLTLTIELDGVYLSFDGGRWAGRIDVALVQKDNSGNEYEYLHQTLGLNLQQDSYDSMLRSGLPYRRALKVNAKATAIRAIVRDARTGNIGSLTIPIPTN